VDNLFVSLVLKRIILLSNVKNFKNGYKRNKMKVKVFHGLKLIQNNVLNAPLILKKIKDAKL